jgi:hypothetical protein
MSEQPPIDPFETNPFTGSNPEYHLSEGGYPFEYDNVTTYLTLAIEYAHRNGLDLIGYDIDGLPIFDKAKIVE